MARFQVGDGEAFAALYRRHREAVFRVCMTRLGDPEAAADATQETFLRAYRRLARFDGGELVGHWLVKMAANYCTDLLRRRRSLSLTGREEDTADDHAESQLRRCDVAGGVRQALAGLGPRDATLLVHHHMLDVPVAELAARAHMTQGSMAVALHRARRRARDSRLFDGLRSLLPVAWWRPLGLRLPAGRAAQPGWAAVGGGLAQLCVAVVLAVAAAVAPPPGASSQGGPGVVGAPGTPHLAGFRSSTTSAGVTAKAPTPDAVVPAAVAHDSGIEPPPQPQPPQPAVAFEPVTVPVVDRRVHQDRPEDPDRRFGVRLEVAGEPVHVWGEGEDEDDTAPADAAACTVSGLAEPHGYCDDSAGVQGIIASDHQ